MFNHFLRDFKTNDEITVVLEPIKSISMTKYLCFLATWLKCVVQRKNEQTRATNLFHPPYQITSQLKQDNKKKKKTNPKIKEKKNNTKKKSTWRQLKMCVDITPTKKTKQQNTKTKNQQQKQQPHFIYANWGWLIWIRNKRPRIKLETKLRLNVDHMDAYSQIARVNKHR